MHTSHPSSEPAAPATSLQLADAAGAVAAPCNPIERKANRVTVFVMLLGLLTGTPVSVSAQQKAPVPTAAELMQALQAKPTRGVSPQMSKEEAERRALIERLKAKATRGLSQPERQQLQKAVSNQPKVDMEVFFEFDSDKITSAAEPVLRSLGEALSNSGSDFLVAGHTDAKGKPGYNQDLSQRRAAAIRDYLASNYKIPAERLMAVGYGREQLKNSADPMAAENRRVQVVNMIER